MPTKSEIEPGEWLLNEGSEARDPLRGVLRLIVEALMGAEADAVCGAHWGERRRDRVNSRNGYRTRAWDTEVGTIDLAIPKLRHGTYFPAWLLDPERRAERELTATILETYGKGMSARRLATLLQTLGMERLSRSQLWKVTREVDGAVRSLKALRRAEEEDEESPEKPAAASEPPEPPDEVWTRDTPTVNRG
jgi:putative transposase